MLFILIAKADLFKLFSCYNLKMEENLSWKIVYFATIFSLLILGFAYYLISPRDPSELVAQKGDKLAELKDTRIEGRKEGKRVWEFFAGEGWTTKDRRITYLLKVRKGKIYNDDQLTVTDLSAPQVKVTGQSEIIEAFGQRDGQSGPSLLSAYLDLGKFTTVKKDKSQWTRLSANYIKYIPQQKKSEISGNVILYKRNMTVRADVIAIDHNSKKADLSGRIRIKREDGIITTDRAEYLGEPEQFNAFGNVIMNILSRSIRTFIKCNQSTLFSDTEKDIALAGSLEVIQGKKVAVGSEGTYSNKQGGLLIKGGTKTIIEKARALLKPETATKLNNPDMRSILKEKTIITSNDIFFSTRTGDARATGKVEVTQKGREARSDLAIYDDKTEILTLSGNVFMKRKELSGKEDWVKCRQVLISIPKETFEAVGAVEAEFKL